MKRRRKKYQKAEKATIAARVEEIFRIRLDGAQFHDILQYAAEKGWNLRERQLRTYIRRADRLMVERQTEDGQDVLARHLAQRMTLYARAVNAADYRTALAILDSEAKLRGLFPSETIKVDTGPTPDLSLLTTEVRATLLLTLRSVFAPSPPSLAGAGA